MANTKAAVPFPATLVVQAKKNEKGLAQCHVMIRTVMYPTTAHPLWYCDEPQCPLFHGKNPDDFSVHGRFTVMGDRVS